VPMMAHAMSMIMGGVFDRFPNLKLLLLGGGATWIPAYLWRTDYQYKLMRHVEAPWLKDVPSSYFLRHVRVSTYQLEAPARTEMLGQVLGSLPETPNLLMYASGYPNVDAETPEPIAARLPKAWHQRVFVDNAEQFYRFPGGSKTRSKEEKALTLQQLQEHTSAAKR